MLVPNDVATPLEALRCILDPIQRGLIAAHVTLCREDELAEIAPSVWWDRVDRWQGGSLELSFGPAERFSGHGILLLCVSGQEVFSELRRHVLGKEDVRLQKAHITLAHPRNAIAKGNDLSITRSLPVPLRIRFDRISHIRQAGADPWQLVDEWPLTRGSGASRIDLDEVWERE